MMFFIFHLDLNSSNANNVCASLHNYVDLIFVCVLISKESTDTMVQSYSGRSRQNMKETKGVRRLTGFWLVRYNFKESSWNKKALAHGKYMYVALNSTFFEALLQQTSKH